MLDKWINGLKKTKEGFLDRLQALVGRSNGLDEGFYEDLEEILITSDMGADTAFSLLDSLREEVRRAGVQNPQEGLEILKRLIGDILKQNKCLMRINDDGLSIYLFLGVNGAGKTTTIAKMGHLMKSKGEKVMFAAADTFRAGAISQLKAWGERLEIPVIAQQEGSDPSAVIFDAIEAAKARGMDILMIDTAGRLHNKQNLMEEMQKMDRVIRREDGRKPEEVFLVIDAGAGQNAVASAAEFKKNIPDISGLILTKLDGTTKGGVVVPLINEIGVPVKYVGLGEGIRDLEPFSPEDFVRGLFGEGEE